MLCDLGRVTWRLCASAFAHEKEVAMGASHTHTQAAAKDEGREHTSCEGHDSYFAFGLICSFCL